MGVRNVCQAIQEIGYSYHCHPQNISKLHIANHAVNMLYGEAQELPRSRSFPVKCILNGERWRKN